MNQALYAHMNNKRKMKKKKRADGVAQGVGPELKTQYCKKKIKILTGIQISWYLGGMQMPRYFLRVKISSHWPL
jgi:hypothetical protein